MYSREIIIGILTGIAYIKRKGSASTGLSIDNVDITVLDVTALDAAKAKRLQRQKELSQYSVKTPNVSYPGAVKSSAEAFFRMEWLRLNPKIIFASDLLFVKNNDSYGEQILEFWKRLPNTQSVSISSVDPSVNVIDYEYPYNIRVSDIVPFDIRAKKVNKKKKTIAPVGEIAFLEYYDVPYTIKIKNARPIGLWSLHQNPNTDPS